MFHQLIVCLMISHKNNIQQLHKRATMLQWILGRFDILQNEFEMRLAKNLTEERALFIAQANTSHHKYVQGGWSGGGGVGGS